MPDRAVEGMLKTYQKAKYGNEIFRLIAPVAYAKRMGQADRAYRKSAFPGTQSFDWLGTQGISGGMSAADINATGSVTSAGLSQMPNHREQDRRDQFAEKQLTKLTNENRLLVEQWIKMSEETKSEAARAKYAAAYWALQASPQNLTRVLYDIKKAYDEKGLLGLGKEALGRETKNLNLLINYLGTATAEQAEKVANFLRNSED